MKWLKLLFVSYIGVLIALFFYSFTQVDLSLTLSKLSFYQLAEKSLQNIGFFQRPLSALIFSIIFLLLFTFWGLFLYLSRKNKLQIKQLKLLIFLTFAILVFSYNAFSYDLFNYIFDAKIVTFYHQNPYLNKASDFISDPMLNFMRWTHRVYPYGPTWLFLTVPLSFIGMGYFLPTFFLFKLLTGFSFLGICFLIYKISEKIFPENKIFNLVFWAFNPLVITEALVSSHNDFSMIFILLFSFYLYLEKKKLSGLIFYLFSIGVKFSTGALLPFPFIFAYFEKRKKQINWEKIFLLAVLLSISTVVFASIRTTFQPWYLIFPLSLATFLSKKYYIFIPSFLFSFFGILIYLPYVYLTDYAPSYPAIIQNVEIFAVAATIVISAFLFVKIKLVSRH